MIDVPEIDTFGSTRDRKISVREVPGFLCAVDVVSQIPLSCDAAFELLTHPDNHKVFRSILRTEDRRMLRDVGAYKKYEVTHITGWKVLWFKGEFRTRLRIEQDRHRGCVSFKLLDSDVMSAFDGRWEVKPCTQRSLDKLYGKPANFNPFAGIADLLASKQHRCLIEFEQKVQPRSIPPALSGLGRRIAANAMKTTLEDVDREAALIEQGRSTIPDLDRFATAGVATRATAPLASVSSAYHVDLSQARLRRRKHGRHRQGAGEGEQPRTPVPAERGLQSPTHVPHVRKNCGGLWRASLGNVITV